MSGTNIRYAAAYSRSMSGTRVLYAATCLLYDVRYGHSVCCYAIAMRYPVETYRMLVRVGYAMSGTRIASLRACYEMSGTEIAYGARRRAGGGSKVCYAPLSAYDGAMRCPILRWRMVVRLEGVSLRVPYAVCGSSAYGLRARYAMPGTEMAYGGTVGESEMRRDRQKCRLAYAISLRVLP
eukprot:1095468-Rhodomonas_salina.2